MPVVSRVLLTSILVPLLFTGAGELESFITVLDAAESELLAISKSSGYSSFLA